MLILIPINIPNLLVMAYLVPEVVRWQIGVAEMWGAFLAAK